MRCLQIETFIEKVGDPTPGPDPDALMPEDTHIAAPPAAAPAAYSPFRNLLLTSEPTGNSAADAHYPYRPMVSPFGRNGD